MAYLEEQLLATGNEKQNPGERVAFLNAHLDFNGRKKMHVLEHLLNVWD